MDPAIRMEPALVKDMEQGIEEVLRKNIRFEHGDPYLFVKVADAQI